MTNQGINQPVVLTIAGFDPSGGAGILADIRTIEAFDCTGVAAITSVTFQNAEKFFGAFHQPAESVRAQVEAIAAAAEIAAVKIGMLPTAEIVREVARLVRDNSLPAPVIDPVMESTSGGKLITDKAFERLVTELLPLGRVVTPNLPEAEKLAGMNIHGEKDMRQAATRIRELGVRAVLIKGGHLGEQTSETGGQTSERSAIDVLDDDGEVKIFRAEWIEAPNVRGTGCMLSSAIAASLAKHLGLSRSVEAAKRYVAERIRLKTEN
jgi:hydroxymethylpyrimidine kinase/phosphomethylpyrimidine kinase